MSDTFSALVVDQIDGRFDAAIKTLTNDDLPAGEVLIDVTHSSLNYKDGMAVTNTGRIIRNFPFVPGIDLAGTVVESASARFAPGDAVIATGYGLGERIWGGYAGRTRLNANLLMPQPTGLTAEQAMAIGTAGFTAMLCVMALEEHGAQPGGREIVVTGASGGVGSVAVALLAKLGFTVVASTGRTEEAPYLKALGASDVIDRSVLGTPSNRPLESERWAGAIDSVGGVTLGNVIRQLAYGASVAACGLAGGNDIPTSVYPFILRNVNLLGVDSVNTPMPRRQAAWDRIARDLPADLLAAITTVHPLADVPALGEAILKGQVRGRVVINVGG